jgi:hypothetical protein
LSATQSLGAGRWNAAITALMRCAELGPFNTDEYAVSLFMAMFYE